MRRARIQRIAAPGGCSLGGKTGIRVGKAHKFRVRSDGYLISPVRFSDSNEDALADMKKLAEAEA